MIASVGQVLINSILPDEFKDYNRKLDSKSLKNLLDDVSKKYPEKYKNIVEAMRNIGQKIAYLDGTSFSLNDFRPYVNRQKLFDAAKRLSIQKNIDPYKVATEFSKIQKDLEDETKKKGVELNNTLAKMVISGARGKPSQLSSTVTSPVMYTDHKDRPIPVPILHSLSEGLSPAEFFANSYGTRKGVYSTKFATPISGYFNKEVGFVTVDMLCTEDDCKTEAGEESPVTDKENIGRVLSKPVKGYPAGTILTNKILSDLVSSGVQSLIIRSPISCQTKDGICKKCFGFNEKGIFPEIGEPVGINSASALTEPFSQGAMDVKHTGGLIGKTKNGIELIQQLLKVPKNFPMGATVSSEEGIIQKIEEAPQGGSYIYVNDVKHYVHPNQEILYKKDDYIEQGLPLSTGIVNPYDVVKYRGIGEGRKLLADSLKEAYINDDKGNVLKKHMEVLARSMINHAEIEDGIDFDDNLPGDIISASKLESIYKPKGVSVVNIDKGIGNYIVKPYLHYSVGTKITPSIKDKLKNFGVKEIEVTDKKPPFNPIMIRMDDVPAYKDNWIERLYSIHLKQKLIESTQRADTADIHSTHFIPSFIHGNEIGKSKVKF